MYAGGAAAGDRLSAAFQNAITAIDPPDAAELSRLGEASEAVAALGDQAVQDGDRVGTLMWNHHEHLETYVGAPVGGFVTHTLNLRLHPDDNTYIASHAGDRVLVVDKVLWPLAEQFVERVGFAACLTDARRPGPSHV